MEDCMLKKILFFSFFGLVFSATTAFATIYSGSISNFGITDPNVYAAATVQGVSNAWGSVSRNPTDRGITWSWTVQSVNN